MVWFVSDEDDFPWTKPSYQISKRRVISRSRPPVRDEDRNPPKEKDQHSCRQCKRRKRGTQLGFIRREPLYGQADALDREIQNERSYFKVIASDIPIVEEVREQQADKPNYPSLVASFHSRVRPNANAAGKKITIPKFSSVCRRVLGRRSRKKLLKRATESILTPQRKDVVS